MLSSQTFAGGLLDRVDALRRDPEDVRRLRADPRARFLLLDRLDALMVPDGSDVLWLNGGAVGDAETVLLGLDGEGVPHFAFAGSAEAYPGVRISIRQVGATLAGDPLCATLAQARSMIDWHQRHGFCAACGHATESRKAGYCRQCPSCQTEHFPRVDPVVIMLATKGDMALLGRQAAFPPRMYSALAGFIEPGESMEEAVARELHEEVGIRIGRVRYLASQPWPFPSNLMLGCIAEARTTELTLDLEEIAEARWVSREECLAALNGTADWTVPPPFAIANALISWWAEGGEA